MTEQSACLNLPIDFTQEKQRASLDFWVSMFPWRQTALLAALSRIACGIARRRMVGLFARRTRPRESLDPNLESL